MKLSKSLKVLIGLVTTWVVLYPLALCVLWFTMFPLMMISGSEPDPFFFMLFGIFMLISIASSFIQWGMTIFYLTHIILNREGSDMARVLLGVGAFTLPFLAMPFYYFIYIWPEQPPAWALRQPPIERTCD